MEAVKTMGINLLKGVVFGISTALFFLISSGLALAQNESGAYLASGKASYFGDGVVRDFAVARKELSKASSLGNSEAAARVAYMDVVGFGGRYEPTSGVAALQSLSGRGDFTAKYYLAILQFSGVSASPVFAGIKRDCAKGAANVRALIPTLSVEDLAALSEVVAPCKNAVSGIKNAIAQRTQDTDSQRQMLNAVWGFWTGNEAVVEASHGIVHSRSDLFTTSRLSYVRDSLEYRYATALGESQRADHLELIGVSPIGGVFQAYAYLNADKIPEAIITSEIALESNRVSVPQALQLALLKSEGTGEASPRRIEALRIMAMQTGGTRGEAFSILVAIDKAYGDSSPFNKTEVDKWRAEAIKRGNSYDLYVDALERSKLENYDRQNITHYLSLSAKHATGSINKGVLDITRRIYGTGRLDITVAERPFFETLIADGILQSDQASKATWSYIAFVVLGANAAEIDGVLDSMKLAAEQGDINAIKVLMDTPGLSVPPEMQLLLMRQSAQTDNEKLALADALREGLGGSPNHVEAASLYADLAGMSGTGRIAAGHLAEMYKTGTGVHRSHDHYIHYRNVARAEELDGQDKFSLGVGFFEGKSEDPSVSVNKRPEFAVFWFDAAGRAGEPRGYWAAAVMYLQGEGIRKDKDKGAYYTKLAANAEIPDAMYRWGRILMEKDEFFGFFLGTNGPTRDVAKGCSWIYKAVAAEDKHKYFRGKYQCDNR
jgi:TPR repeat protein